MGELDLRFHDKKRVVSNGSSPGVDPRFNREKAKRMHKTDRTFVENIEPSVIDESENIPIEAPMLEIPPVEDPHSIRPKRSKKQKEEINADDIDI